MVFCFLAPPSNGKRPCFLCTHLWVSFNCTLGWGLPFGHWIRSVTLSWQGGIETERQKCEMHSSCWCLQIKTELEGHVALCQKVLNIACRACSSNRPISRASDWPIFSCLGSTTSRWKTLEEHGSVFLLQPSYAYIQPIHLSHHIPATNTLKPSYKNKT